MEQETSRQPLICMQRDYQAVEFVINRVKRGEPCSVLGLPQIGEVVIYKELVNRLGGRFGGFRVVSLQATTEEELQSLLKAIEHSLDYLIVLVYLTCNQDNSWFMTELEKLRARRSGSFVSVVIATLPEVKKSFEQSDKILTRSLFMLKPTELDDSEILLRNFVERFEYEPTQTQRAFILEHSLGIAGILKSLYLLAADNPDAELTIEDAVINSAISARIKTVIDYLGLELIQAWSNNDLQEFQKITLSQLGLSQFPDLFSEYINKFLPELSKTKRRSMQLELALTSQEQKVFTLLSDRQGEVVTREQIGEVLWGTGNKEEYSDMAIDAIIHRLRTKINEAGAGYKITARKGRGYVFIL